MSLVGSAAIRPALPRKGAAVERTPEQHVDIRLLGPLRVVGPHGPVTVPGAVRRTLLGLLALRPDEVVTISHLVDALWEESPPASARKTLQSHVAHLRHALAAAGLPALIRTHGPAYRLDVRRDVVDASRFEGLVRRGRAALSNGDARAAVTHLTGALRLWRGDLLADCHRVKWAEAEANRLAEIRLLATEDLLDSRLALGAHAAVIGEIELLVCRHPFRERLWELLVLALYRAGRPRDALAAYQRARSVLREELGIEPGPGLRQLQAGVLAADPALEPPRATAPPEPAASWHLLPLPVPLTRLIGRRRELSEVTDLVAAHRLVTLTGVGGCGKTRLAVAAAGRLTTGDTLFVDLNAVTDPAAVPAAVAAGIGLTDAGAGPLAARLRDRDVLLVLDNCEHLVDACAQLAATLLRTCPRLRVLATSREALRIPGEVAWLVPPLAVPDPAAPAAEILACPSVELFLDRAAHRVRTRLAQRPTPADIAALAKVCAGLDGLPLALELAAGRTEALGLSEIAARLPDRFRILHTTQRGVRPQHQTLRATMDWSYELLNPAEQTLLRLLSAFPNTFTLAAAEALATDPAAGTGTGTTVLDLLTGLVGKSLVVVEHGNAGDLDEVRFRLLETVRQYAAARLPDTTP